MNRRFVVGTMVMAASLFASEAVLAQPAAMHVPVNAIFAKVKTVRFSMRNDSSAPIQVKCGDKEMTLEPGKATDVKLQEGEKIVAVNATSHYEAGAVLAVASSNLNDTTVVLR